MDNQLVSFYYIYVITNLINGKTYTGQKKCIKQNPETDGYLGSGRIIRNSILKHGEENFKKEIKFSGFVTQDDINELERYYITLGKMCGKNEYNIAKGGYGGDTYSWQSDEKKKYIKQKRKEKMLKKIEEGWCYKGLERISDDHKQALKEGYENWLKNGDRDDIGKRIVDGWGQKREAYLEYVHSAEYLQKIKDHWNKYYEDNDTWNKGRTNVYTQEQLKRIGDGVKNGYKNKVWTVQDFEKKSKSSRGRVTSEETKERLRKPRPNYKKAGFLHRGWTIICNETNEEMTIQEAVNKYGSGHYNDVCNGKRKSAGGHTWRWGNPPNKN